MVSHLLNLSSNLMTGCSKPVMSMAIFGYIYSMAILVESESNELHILSYSVSEYLWVNAVNLLAINLGYRLGNL